MKKGSGTLGNHMPSDWLQRKLAQLEKELAESSQAPAAVDQLLRLLAEPVAASSKEKEFEELLSLIINDALNGVDIFRRYPAFFEQLVTDTVLRETFLDALEVLELSRAGKLESLPEGTSYDLSFLNKQVLNPKVEIAGSGHWRVGYQQTAAQIETLFTDFRNRSAEGPFRSVYNYLDDDHIILMQDTVTIDEGQYEILLEAIRQVDEPEQLDLLLLVGTDHPAPPTMEAYIQWGSYEASLMLNNYGLGRFTAVPLTAVLDKSGRVVTEDLHLEFGPVVNSQEGSHNN